MFKKASLFSMLLLMSVLCFSVNVDLNKLMAKMDAEGYIHIIVKIDVPEIKELTERSTSYGVIIPGGRFPAEGLAADKRLRDAIHMTADSVLDCLKGMDFKDSHTFNTIPYISLSASPEVVEHLQDMPQVLGIEEDALLPLADETPTERKIPAGKHEFRNSDIDAPNLTNTVKIVGADDVWAMGVTGAGWYVAVLDTGIRRTHQFFTGKTIREACFSNSSHCPNGSTSQYGTGSAAHYPSSYEGYDHGTHVAGIATGNYGSMYGVAKGSNIIAVQVFSKFGPSNCDGGYCVRTWNVDQLKGLEYIYSLRNTYSIASVNMSLGGGAYSAYCDSDARKAAILNLKTARIGTAIATGNDGYCGLVGSPACISTAIAVGASTDADAEASFNNWHATLLELYAPGYAIYSSTGGSDSSYQSWNGTSMATPHVAGALALLRNYSPTATVDQMYSALRTTGKSITSVCNTSAAGVPRIQIEKALAKLTGAAAAITVTSPNGGENWTVGSSRTITWTSTGTVGNVKIIYTTNNGSTWVNIVSTTANDGSYTWTVPNTLSSQCKVIVKEASDGIPSDVSNSTFSITTASSGNPVIALNRTSLYFGGVAGSGTPSSQELWVTNSGTGTMTWTGSDDKSWLSISPTASSGSAIATVTANPTGLAAGTYTGKITITCAAASNSPRTVSVTLTVKNSAQNAAPFGSMETPVNGAVLQSSIPVTGWALDDTGLSSVKIYAVKNGVQYYVGAALQITGARPDVQAAYPTYPGSYKAGWGYMLLTYFLPGGGTGAYTLKAIATDLWGKQTVLPISVNVTVKNSTAVKPFGAMDSPAPGGVASGASFLCDGWALTPLPSTIPTNGSTIIVQVDGASIGHANYNVYRSDIATAFPGYNNSNGAYVYKTFNSKNYSNGLHSIQWVVTDNYGNGDGIGSRYFVVMNATSSREGESQNAEPTPLMTLPGEIAPEIPSRILEGMVMLKGTERVAGRIFPAGEITDAWVWLDNEKHPLPVGSTLDKKNAAFFWHPGPAFKGDFELVFQGKDAQGILLEKRVMFHIEQ